VSSGPAELAAGPRSFSCVWPRCFSPPGRTGASRGQARRVF